MQPRDFLFTAALLALAALAGRAAVAQGEPALHQGDRAPLEDPFRPVAEITRSSFTLQYFTAVPCETRVQIRQGDLPMVAWRPPSQREQFYTSGTRTVEGSSEKSSAHALKIAGLKPGVRYFYRIYDPGAEPTPQERKWGAERPWRREYAVSTQAPRGRKTIIHIPVKVLLMPNVINVASAHDAAGPIAPEPPKMTSAELDRIRQEYATTSRFFWVNSGMRLWVDFRIQTDERWQRWGSEPMNASAFYRGWPVCRSYAGVDFADPGGGDFTIVDTKNPGRVNRKPVYEERPFSGQIEQAYPRRWNKAARKWEFYNSGGGTLGVDGFPDGIPGRSQFLGGGDTAWLACHEFHHDLESHGGFSLADREDDRVVFDHFEPRRRVTRPNGQTEEMDWTTSGRHGEHWSGIAYWDRTLTDAQWLRMYLGYTLTVADHDEDGFPDDDPRLPLDEKRFGGSPRKAETDGRLGDLRKVMLSEWVPSSLQYSLNKPPFQAFRPDPTNPDSDRDGLNDDVDPYPLYRWQPLIWPMHATIDGDDGEWASIPAAGEMDEGGMRVAFRQAHDTGGYYGLFTVRGPWRRVYVSLDGEGKGYFSGEGVVSFEVLNGAEVTVRPLRVPFIDAAAPGLKWKAARKPGGATTVELSLPNRGDGLWFWNGGGREVGASVDVYAEDGKGYSMYEPYQPFYARMLETHGRPQMPANAPAELSRESAAKVLLPGDPKLKLTGRGWQRDGDLLRHTGNDESVAYVDGLNATEFDLWMRFEAKQDAVLGGFAPGTTELGAGSDYIAFVGGYANTVSRFRLFGREEGDGDRVLTPGEHTMQLSRRDGEVWCLLDGKPVLWAVDPQPGKTVDRLGIIGGYGGDQVIHEIRIRTSQ